MTNFSISKGLNRVKEVVKFDKEETVYLLLAVARKKYNPLTKGTEIVFREIITKKNFEKKYKKIITLAENFCDGEGNKFKFYIYLTVNPRSLIKTFSSFISKYSKWILELHHDKPTFFNKVARLDSYWYSELMKPENKAGRLFLLDVDSKNEMVIAKLEHQIKMRKVKVINRYETLHGFHYLTEPFNRTKFKVENVEVKIDANLFIDEIGFNKQTSEQQSLIDNFNEIIKKGQKAKLSDEEIFDGIKGFLDDWELKKEMKF